MTLPGTLLAYLQSKWSLAVPPATDITWREGWFDSQYAHRLQVTCTPLTEPVFQRFRGTAKMYLVNRPIYLFNVWRMIDRGMQGDTQLGSVLAITKEIYECFRKGFADNYGGSLSPFGVVLPMDKGVPHHSLNVTPRVFRYEVTVIATEHFSS